MARKAQYNAAETITTGNADAYLRPAFPLRLRMKRLVWSVVWTLLYRPSPRSLHGWRAILLRTFGARVGANCHFYPKSKIWAPWNLICDDQVTAADGAEIYNPAPMTFGSHAILSQDSYLCGATHDYDDPDFPLIAFAMQVESLQLDLRACFPCSRRECGRRGSPWAGIRGHARSGPVDCVCRRAGGKGQGACATRSGGRVISVLVLTKNEEQDLPGCLASVSWSDDVQVLDSMSTDRTVEIARGYGAQVTQRVFDNWAAHQNWALANLRFRNPWIFYIDADERVTPALRESMLAAVQRPGELVAFRVERRDFLMGTWLRHVQVSAFYMRLFRPEKMRYERLVNPVSLPDGPVGNVSGYLDHFPFSKGISQWITRHNSYSTLEAQQILANPGARPRLP